MRMRATPGTAASSSASYLHLKDSLQTSSEILLQGSGFYWSLADSIQLTLDTEPAEARLKPKTQWHKQGLAQPEKDFILQAQQKEIEKYIIDKTTHQKTFKNEG